MHAYAEDPKITLPDWEKMGRLFNYKKGSAELPIFYVDTQEQSKPVLLLIHGFPTCSWDWNPLWEDLSQYFRLITCDLLGFGFSAKPLGYKYSILDQADVLKQLCEMLGATKVHVLAHDYGDTVAQELIARNDQANELRVISCAFLNGGLFPEVHRPAFIQRLLISPLGSVIAKLSSYKSFKANFDRICRIPIRDNELLVYWELLIRDNGKAAVPSLIKYMKERKKHRSRWVSALQKSEFPMILINGIEDPISGLHMADRYRQLVSREAVVELPGVGHYPQLEAPDKVYEALLGFWFENNIQEKVEL